MRLFVALALPADVQAHLDLAVGAMWPDGAVDDPRRGPQPLRWVPLDQRHVTLAFYGEVPDGVLPEVEVSLGEAAARFAPLRLELRGAGVFSHRTLWVGVHQPADGGASGDDATSDGGVVGGAVGGVGAAGDAGAVGGPVSEDGLVRLMSACEDAGEPFARVERRDRHRAHVTIARLSARRPASDELASRAHALSVYAGPPWTATEVDLVASRPGAGKSGGPLYEVLARFPLGGTAGDEARTPRPPAG
ncbi:2'-5' RNA ligase family protein [Georgenia sp. SYP-B2076]|uniref:2'-5' RNA ligase family protein n=1 Tax=Georgenia sp. SYP-B2076 TaxID=2495881 RepID=UPI000F8C8EA1|nr:2'-5' RNA ligase family protein [Georgenia sp. SYP-B2076]